MSRYSRFRTPLVLKSSDCGANGPGGGVFQPGNTCAKEDGSAEKSTGDRKPGTVVLYRAADDDIVTDSASFSESLEAAQQYLNNPGFGGRKIFRAEVRPEKVLDITDADDPTQALADAIGARHPGAIGADEWAPRISDRIARAGYDWVRVRESYPADSVTWIWVGGDEPELVGLSDDDSEPSAPAKPPAPVPDEQNPDIGPRQPSPNVLQAMDKVQKIAESRSETAGNKTRDAIENWVAATKQHGAYSTIARKAMQELKAELVVWSHSAGAAIDDGMVQAARAALDSADQVTLDAQNARRAEKFRRRTAAALAMKRTTKPHEVPLSVWITRKLINDREEITRLHDWAKRLDKTIQHLHNLETYSFSEVPQAEQLPQEFASRAELYDWLADSKEFKKILKLRPVRFEVQSPNRQEMLEDAYTDGARSILRHVERRQRDLEDLMSDEPIFSNYVNPYREKYQEAMTEQLVNGADIPLEILEEVQYEEWFREFQPKLEMSRSKTSAKVYLESDAVKALAVESKLKLDRARNQATQIVAQAIDAHARKMRDVMAIVAAETKAQEAYFDMSEKRRELSRSKGHDHPDTVAAAQTVDEALQKYADLQEQSVIARRQASTEIAKALTLPPERRARVTIRPTVNDTGDTLSEETLQRLKEAEAFLSGMIDKDVVEHLEMKARPLEREKHRANAWGDTMRIRTVEATDVIIHEAGHILENANGGVLAKLSTGFLANQLAGEEIRNLIEESQSYNPHEVAAKDGFLDSYSGKVYDHGSTEILSMGLQRLYEGTTGFLTDSPEHAIYTIAAIRGLLTEAPPKPEPEAPQPPGKKRQRELFAKFLQLAECRAFMSQIVDKATQPTLFGDDCGAKGPGGGGFQPGNTCGRASGRSGSSGAGRRRSRSEDTSVRKFDFDAPKPKQDEPQPHKKRSEDDGSNGVTPTTASRY